MKRGRCPKCNSTNVRDGSGIPYKKGLYAQYAIKVSFASAAALDYYVCADCGYVEGYVSSKAKLETISEQWPRVRSSN
jgi:predicted nucleic-acid-binding Zn-ribbon protein